MTLSRNGQRIAWGALAGVCLVLATADPAHGQSRTAVNARIAAPVDLSGYWVSVITEDWRFRMITPAKGDYAGVPLNEEGRKFADAWSPARDEAAAEPCKAFGAPAILRMPTRLHIYWADESTLRVDTDAGEQSRVFPFVGQAAAGTPQWQGNSIAQWELAVSELPMGQGGPALREEKPRGGSLKVVTTHMRAGYLRKNGVPYSENATLTEYFSRTWEPNGDSWLLVTSIVEDPRYLTQPFLTSAQFKKQEGSTGWNPRPCGAK
ncbi:MAG: hypothetical protein ABL967_10490 [Bryobacteraceae bacterium]